MLLSILGASLLGNMFASKSFIRVGDVFTWVGEKTKKKQVKAGQQL